MDAARWYEVSRRRGSGSRSASLKPMSLTMWPRNEVSSTSPFVSVGLDRGLANCPAMRPTFTSGTPPE